MAREQEASQEPGQGPGQLLPPESLPEQAGGAAMLTRWARPLWVFVSLETAVPSLGCFR